MCVIVEARDRLALRVGWGADRSPAVSGYPRGLRQLGGVVAGQGWRSVSRGLTANFLAITVGIAQDSHPLSQSAIDSPVEGFRLNRGWLGKTK